MSESILHQYRLVIFDADDTLRRTTVPGQPSPHAPDQWELMPGVRETLGRLSWGPTGHWFGVATNQDQIAYGHVTLEMARRLLRDLAIAGIGSSPAEPALQLCPHALDVSCDCRKPAPGMLLKIMDHYAAQSGSTVFVGNHEIDRETARRAGVAFVWSEQVFGAPVGQQQ